MNAALCDLRKTFTYLLTYLQVKYGKRSISVCSQPRPSSDFLPLIFDFCTGSLLAMNNKPTSFSMHFASDDSSLYCMSMICLSVCLSVCLSQAVTVNEKDETYNDDARPEILVF